MALVDGTKSPSLPGVSNMNVSANTFERDTSWAERDMSSKNTLTCCGSLNFVASGSCSPWPIL
jgi:hypothetical protein